MDHLLQFLFARLYRRTGQAVNGHTIVLGLEHSQVVARLYYLRHLWYHAIYAVRAYGDGMNQEVLHILWQFRSGARHLVSGQTDIIFHTVILCYKQILTLCHKVHDILYAEVTGHRVFLHTASGKLAYRASLKELAAQLPGRWFSMPHQSYIVNMLHVRSVSALSLSLTNGTEIPISRRKQQEFLSNFHRFLGV
jgi:hypothetical protein